MKWGLFGQMVVVSIRRSVVFSIRHFKTWAFLYMSLGTKAPDSLQIKT